MKLLVKKIIIILIFLSITFCSFKKIDDVHGIINLDNKFKSLEEGVTNKNDVIVDLGPPPIKEYQNLNTWVYFEVRSSRNIYGFKEILTNNTLILNFNEKGLLSKKIFFDKTKMKSIKFDEKNTISMGVNNNLLKDVLSSTRKRMQKMYEKK